MLFLFMIGKNLADGLNNKQALRTEQTTCGYRQTQPCNRCSRTADLLFLWALPKHERRH